VGAPSSTLNPGKVYLLLSTLGDPRLPGVAGLSLDLSGATPGFGSFVAGGFDYDGDGYPDLAVVDVENATVHLFH
jgi:hypothetical protein